VPNRNVERAIFQTHEVLAGRAEPGETVFSHMHVVTCPLKDVIYRHQKKGVQARMRKVSEILGVVRHRASLFADYVYARCLEEDVVPPIADAKFWRACMSCFVPGSNWQVRLIACARATTCSAVAVHTCPMSTALPAWT
jgi:hypothetical protein